MKTLGACSESAQASSHCEVQCSWWHDAGILEGIFSVGMLFLGWRTLSGARKAVQKVATMPQKS